MRTSNNLMASLALLLVAGTALADDEPVSDAAAIGIHTRVGGGIYLLDLPESSPFIRTNGREEVVDLLDYYDVDSRAGAFGSLAVGRSFEGFGRPMVAEISGFLASASWNQASDHDEDDGPWTDIRSEFEERHCQGVEFGACLGADTESFLVAMIRDDPDVRSVGWVGRIDGAELPFSTPNFAWGDPIHVDTDRDIRFAGVDLVSGIQLNQGEVGPVSFVAGPSYKHLAQEGVTFAYESNRPPDVNYMTLNESLDAAYLGLVAGVRMAMPLTGVGALAVDGRLGLYRASVDYVGSQQMWLSSGSTPIDERSDWTTEESATATALGIRATLDIAAFQGSVIQFATGYEYLSHAPVMRYATLGESFASGNRHTPARIDFANASSWFGELRLSFEL